MEIGHYNWSFGNMSVNKSEIAGQVAERTGMSKAAAGEAVNAVMESIRTSLQEDGEVRLPGFGTFRAVDRPASTARNPRTGEPIAVPAGRRLRFRPARALREGL